MNFFLITGAFLTLKKYVHFKAQTSKVGDYRIIFLIFIFAILMLAQKSLL